MRTRAAPPTSRRENRHTARNTNAMKDLQYSLHLRKKSEKEKQNNNYKQVNDDDEESSLEKKVTKKVKIKVMMMKKRVKIFHSIRITCYMSIFSTRSGGSCSCSHFILIIS